MERLVAVKPAAVQLYTLARGCPSDDLCPAPQAALRKLAESAHERGIPVNVF